MAGAGSTRTDSWPLAGVSSCTGLLQQLKLRAWHPGLSCHQAKATPSVTRESTHPSVASSGQKLYASQPWVLAQRAAQSEAEAAASAVPMLSR